MEFLPEKVSAFLAVFEASKQQIRGFSGCNYLALHTDSQRPNVKYTYSLWNSEEALTEYRNSDLFRETWAATKVLFQAKPQAFSLTQPEEVML